MKFSLILQTLLPQHHLSRAVGWLAKQQQPGWLPTLLIRLFMRAYGISLAEADISRAEDFPDFNAFFTRALREGARPLADSRYVAPADGEVSQRGPIESGSLIQAKGRNYSVAALLGGDEVAAQAYQEGSFATIYLSPRDYHRIHMPITGTLRRTCYVPGDLFAVNLSTAAAVDGLFARNERLICHFETADGPLVMVLVGAMIVAGIETAWGGVEDPQPNTIREMRWAASEGPTLAAGDEVGRFFLGSTVILLSPSQLNWQVEPGESVRVRAALAG